MCKKTKYIIKLLKCNKKLDKTRKILKARLTEGQNNKPKIQKHKLFNLSLQ